MTQKMWRLLCQICPSLLPRRAQHSTAPQGRGSKPKSHSFFPPFFSCLFVFQAKLPRPEHAPTAAVPRNQLCRNNIATRSRGKG